MFGLFGGNKVKKLEKEYARIMEQAMNAQRNGDIAKFAELSAKADEVNKKIEEASKES